ncbi:DoxX family protein (plasmid) [Paroceanicella profunda]|uniref:DoxX family protein n=1 Tax=Paroceanicella profunda TaxID=2579971 RepID=A0A5B8G009_9RHOB|nr:DoxX family protein [Paroceanicella profunda]QDL94496.1 DoxX family protein [Paroceanicella profunda]
MTDTLRSMAPMVLSLVRLVTGLIFMEHGLQKLLGFPPTDNTWEAFSLSWVAGCFELACGALIAIGFLTRPAAFVASGVMAFAYWIAHAPRDVFPVNNGGDAAILYCFFFLYLVFAGPGPVSVDGMRGRAA